MNVLPYEGDDDVVSGQSEEYDECEHALLRKLTEKALISNYKDRKKRQNYCVNLPPKNHQRG